MTSLFEVQKLIVKHYSEEQPEPLKNDAAVVELLNDLNEWVLAKKWNGFEGKREVINKLKNNDVTGGDEGLWWLGVELEKIFVSDQFAMQDTGKRAVSENELGRLVQYKMDTHGLSVNEACKQISSESRKSTINRKDVLSAKRCKDAWKRWTVKDQEKRKPPTGAFWIQ